MFKVVQEEKRVPAARPAAVGGSLLDELARDGARQMLAAALLAEVAAYMDTHADQLDAEGRRLVVSNGFHDPREVATAAGAVPVRAPRVNDKRIDEATGERVRFSSAILPAWARKSPGVAEVLPLLYLHGLSSGDFVPAFDAVPRLDRGSVRGNGHPADRTVAGRREDLRPAVVGRVRLRLPVGRRDPPQGPPRGRQGVPAGDDRCPRRRHQGARRPVRRVSRELESWADLLRDCKRRGMRAPVLAVGDGALGFWKALREVFPDTREQRCSWH